MGLEAVLLRQRGPVVAHGHGQEVILDVRVANAGAAADEAAGLEVVARSESIPGEQPAHADEGLAKRARVGIEGDGLRGGHLEIELQMILKVLADARQVVDHRDAVARELRGRPDARELQQLRRLNGSGAQDHFAARVCDLRKVWRMN